MAVRDLIEKASGALTPTERKLATVLLADYPFSGMLSIQELSARAAVSAPSISRFTAKIGLPGYAEMQRLLLEELREGDRSPVELSQSAVRIEGGYLAGFLGRAAERVQAARQAITEAQFDRICDLLADPRRKIFSLGGRNSDIIAQHLTFHMRQARGNVFHLPRDAEAWPEYLLRMDAGDVFFLVDFRRYEHRLGDLAEMAAARKVKVVLMTDKWMTHNKRHAAELLVVPIETGTIWDSYAAAIAITEALVTRVAETTWDKTRKRIETWDALRSSPLETKE